MSRDYDVVVVGAGVAGLTAAHSLVRAGRSVRVLEARNAVGGRMRSVDRSGLHIDLGATWFWHNEPQVVALLDSLELTAFDQAIAGDAVFDTPDSPPRRLSGNPIDVPSFRFGDGAQSVPVALADRLGDDVVSLANPVHRVEIDGDRVAVHAARGRFGAQHVVVAVPPPLAVETITITPDLDRSVASVAASTAVWMGQTVKAVAVYDEPFWRQAGLAGSVFSHRGPFREIHDHSGPGSGPGALFGFAPSTAFRDGADIPSAFIHQLTRVFGEYAARPLDVVAADWRRERFTSPAAAAPRAGTASYGHSVFQAPVHGRLHWAATETATAFAGHVEGAILAAAAAVDRIERAISMI